MALATPREVQEMDISLLLELPSWLEDECEFDIINLNKLPDPEPVQPTSFLVIQVHFRLNEIMHYFNSYITTI